jgi:hypothetical protein
MLSLLFFTLYLPNHSTSLTPHSTLFQYLLFAAINFKYLSILRNTVMGSSPSIPNPSLTVSGDVHSNLATPSKTDAKTDDSDVALPTDGMDTPPTTHDDPLSPFAFVASGLAIASPKVVVAAPSLSTPLGIRNLPPPSLRTQSSGTRYPPGDLASPHCSTGDRMYPAGGGGGASFSLPDIGPSSPLNCSSSGKRGGVSTIAALTRRHRGMESSITSLQSVNFMRTVSNPQQSGSAYVRRVPSPKVYTSVINDRSPLATCEDVMHANTISPSQPSSTMSDEGRSAPIPAHPHHLPALRASIINGCYSTISSYHHQSRRGCRKRSPSLGSDNSHSDVISTNGDASDDDCFQMSFHRGATCADPSMSLGEVGACLFSQIYRPKDHRVSGLSVHTSTTPSASNGISGSLMGEPLAMSSEVSTTTTAPISQF